MSEIDIEKLLNESCEFKQDEPLLEEAAAHTVEAVWSGMNFEGMQPRRLQNIYKEYGNKLKNAAYTNTYSEFITNLTEALGVESLPKIQNRLISSIEEELVKRKLQNDFLEYIVENYRTLVIKFRAKKDSVEDEKQCKPV